MMMMIVGYRLCYVLTVSRQLALEGDDVVDFCDDVIDVCVSGRRWCADDVDGTTTCNNTHDFISERCNERTSDEWTEHEHDSVYRPTTCEYRPSHTLENHTLATLCCESVMARVCRTVRSV